MSLQPRLRSTAAAASLSIWLASTPWVLPVMPVMAAMAAMTSAPAWAAAPLAKKPNQAARAPSAKKKHPNKPSARGLGKGHGKGGKPDIKPRVTSSTTGPLWGTASPVRDFAQEVAQKHGLPPAWVLGHLSQARRVQVVRDLIAPPPNGTVKNWAAYRERFIEPDRIAAGAAFWARAEPWLRQAEQRWGVPADIVVGIIGVETFYGRVMGNFRVIDALATLAFDFPTTRRDRSEFFRSELEALLVWSHREGRDPQAMKGSYAGASGLPQFMPSSIQRWAVDMDGNGRIDLQDSEADVVGSVAHYLASFGWQSGLPTHYAVTPPPPGAERSALLAPDILPSFSAAQMQQRGALLADAGLAHPGPLALVELENGGAPASYVAGTQNFYVVTRYNWSSYYAMAVIDLAQAVASRRASGTAGTPPAR